MTLQFFTGIATTLLLSVITFAQQPSSDELPDSDLTLKPVPPILRLHLPILGPQNGVLVEKVATGSASEKAGLRAGDLLIAAGGRPVIAGDSLKQLDASLPIVVLRRGRPRVFGGSIPATRFPRSDVFDSFGAPATMFDPNLPWGTRGSVGVSSSASSSNFGDRAVAVSRAGDQISLEMSIPGWSDKPIRLHGTAEEIENQLRSGSISNAVKRQVRAALRQ